MDCVEAADRLRRVTWNTFWVAPSSTVVDRPELLAVATPGESGPLNAVYRAQASNARCPALIAEVDQLHAETSSRWQLHDDDDTKCLEGLLTTAGYARTHVHDARIVAASDFVSRSSDRFSVREVVDLKTLRDSYVVSKGAFGHEGRVGSEEQDLRQFTDAHNPAHFYVVYDGDEPVCAGGLNCFANLGMGFLWAGGTIPAARGRGAYSSLVAARIAVAAAAGLSHVGLYARVGSSSPIVAAQGFVRCGQMSFWERPPR